MMISVDRSRSAHWEAYWNAATSRRAAVSGDAPGDLFDGIWRGFLTNQMSERVEPSLLDIACGAGVLLDRVFEASKAIGNSGQFIGLDYAVSAAASIALRSPPAGALLHGVAASAAALPFADGAFDVVISQFGIEYAGPDAFEEAARILAPGGALQFVIHYKGGGIDLECTENSRVLQAILQSGLFEIAVEALRGPDAEGAVAKLNSIFETLKSCLEGERVAAKEMLARLLGDVSRLVARRQAYHPAEAAGWCEAMRSEVALYESRMRAMTDSALDQAGIEAARERLGAHGAKILLPEALTPAGKNAPAAWLLRTHNGA